MDIYADQLSIDTPEQVELRFPIAGMGSRMIAVLLDLVIQAFVYLVLATLAYVTNTYRSVDAGLQSQSATALNWLVALIVLLNFLALTGYYLLFEAFWAGQTPGKRLMKLRVIKDTGRAITLFESMARNLLRAVDWFPGFYLSGLVTMLCNRSNKRLGDLAAGTLVVHERRSEQPMLMHAGGPAAHTLTARPAAAAQPMGLMPQARAAWEAGDRELPADAVARLKASDLNAIETFFSRALDLPVAQRQALGARVAATMSERMGLERPAGMAPERMLELIAFKMRAQGR